MFYIFLTDASSLLKPYPPKIEERLGFSGPSDHGYNRAWLCQVQDYSQHRICSQLEGREWIVKSYKKGSCPIIVFKCDWIMRHCKTFSHTDLQGRVDHDRSGPEWICSSWRQEQDLGSWPLHLRAEKNKTWVSSDKLKCFLADQVKAEDQNRHHILRWYFFNLWCWGLHVLGF